MKTYINKLLTSLKSPAMAKIWASSKGERGKLLLLSFLQAVSALLSLAYALVTKEVVDSAVRNDMQRFTTFAVILCSMVLISLALNYGRNIFAIRIRANLLRRMRAEAIRQVLGKRYGDISSYHSGELVNKLFSDVSVVTNGILNVVPPMLYLLIQLVGAAIILFTMNPVFLVIVLAAGILGTAASFLFKNKMKTFHKETMAAEDRLHANIQETIGNLRIVKASASEERMVSESDKLQLLFTNAQLRNGRFSSFMGTGLGFVFQGSYIYAMIWGCLGIANGSITYGSLTALLQLVSKVQSPFEGFISTLSTLYGAISSAERLMEVYNLPDDEQALRLGTDELSGFEGISISSLEFSYGEEKIIKKLSLDISKGDAVAITGPSGVGKTTLFSLLLGLYEPLAGSITKTLGGKEYKEKIAGLFAYVPQGNALFSGTLRDNICLFRADQPANDEIMEAAREACIDDFIMGLDKGLDSMIGERGVGISEGQAQRIAIARALLTKAPVLLLDEATSALDSDTEARLLANIKKLKDRTCLIVTHRSAALEITNKTIKL